MYYIVYLCNMDDLIINNIKQLIMSTVSFTLSAFSFYQHITTLRYTISYIKSLTQIKTVSPSIQVW